MKYSFLVLSLSAVLSACGPSKDETKQQEHVIQMKSIVSNYFGTEVNAGSFGKWPVKSIEIDSANPFSEKIHTILVTVEVSQSVASDILYRSIEGRLRAVGSNACPRKSDAVWGAFTGNDFLTLQVAVNGNIFIDVDCKRWGDY